MRKVMAPVRNDVRGVTPVVAVVLVVAITVVLGGTTGALVLGLDVLPETQPPAAVFAASQSDDSLSIAHRGGGDIAVDHLALRGVAGTPTAYTPDDRLSTGETLTIPMSDVQRDRVMLLWRNGETGVILTTIQVSEETATAAAPVELAADVTDGTWEVSLDDPGDTATLLRSSVGEIDSVDIAGKGEIFRANGAHIELIPPKQAEEYGCDPGQDIVFTDEVTPEITVNGESYSVDTGINSATIRCS